MKRIILIFLSIWITSCGNNQTDTGDFNSEAVSQTVYQWKMVTTWPKNLPGLGTAPERMAKKIEIMSNGRLKIKVYGAGEIVPAMEVFETVSQGTVQLGHGASYYWKGKVPIAQFFTAVPFGLTAQEMNGWLLHGGGLELWRELYERYNLFPIPSGNTGVQMAGWFNKEITSLKDIEGLKMRIPGLGGEVFSRAGGAAVRMPASEIYSSMQTGVIDATEWVGPYNDLALGLHQTAKFYYYPGWQEAGPALELIVNKEAWNNLPPDLQAILETASLAANTDMLAEYTARNNFALRELVDKHGVELKRLPDDVLETFREISYEMTAGIPDVEDELSQRIYQSYDEYRKGVINYHEISERAFINVRGDGK
ncbi:MAG: ABC transporter substrate-binding protein [Gammaproteobacteria bacterium]|nr:ABC transporter substrate-binding protein [Gammaproteobacteria bacterium]|tara:strand:- start:776 stop:1876 length:1101 start_codon:yes stop_codon:yes gene_type:complete